MNIPLPLLPALLFLLAVPAAPVTAAEAEWTDLLAGDSLEAWCFDVLDYTPPAQIWTLQNGLLKVAGKGQSPGVLRTLKDYEDFEFELEWRWPAEPGNCGVLLYCSSPRFMSIWPRSLEVQLLHGHAGDFYFIGETAQIFRPEQVPYPAPGQTFREWEWRNRRNLTDDSEKPAGEWNHLRILSARDRLLVTVNGILVNDAFLPSATRGAICLQAERADIEFRRVRVRPVTQVDWKHWNPAQR